MPIRAFVSQIFENVLIGHLMKDHDRSPVKQKEPFLI